MRRPIKLLDRNGIRVRRGDTIKADLRNDYGFRVLNVKKHNDPNCIIVDLLSILSEEREIIFMGRWPYENFQFSIYQKVK